MTLNAIIKSAAIFLTSKETIEAVTSTRGLFEAIIFSPQLHDFLAPIRNVMIFWSILMAFCVAYFLKTSKKFETMYWSDFRDFLKFKPANVIQRNTRWSKVMRRISSPLEPEWRLGVIEGFEMLEECFFELSSKDIFDEEVVALSGSFPEFYEDVLKARELQQKIINDPDLVIEKAQAQIVLDVCEKVMRKLKWL